MPAYQQEAVASQGRSSSISDTVGQKITDPTLASRTGRMVTSMTLKISIIDN